MSSSAGNFVMSFGKFAGQSLDEVAGTDAGLRYLDWLLGELEAGVRMGFTLGERRAKTLVALRLYLTDPAIAREVARAVEEAEE